jgi:hypothetical protein
MTMTMMMMMEDDDQPAKDHVEQQVNVRNDDGESDGECSALPHGETGARADRLNRVHRLFVVSSVDHVFLIPTRTSAI